MKKYIFIFLAAMIFSGCTTPQTLKNGINGIDIHDIQGCTHISPYVNHTVNSITGIVTWKDEKGFFFQDITPDEKDCSSEAIYVFTNNFPDVIPGDKVSVNGQVKEFTQSSQTNVLSTTEIVETTTKILSTGNLLPSPVVIGQNGRIPPLIQIEDDSFVKFDPESDGIDFYESLEGMRVEIDNAVVVNPENSYKEVVVIPGEYLDQNIVSEQGALVATLSDRNPERITINLPESGKKVLNLGTTFSSPIIGILNYQYGNYAIIATNNPATQAAKTNVKTLSDLRSGNALRLTTYNVENLNRFDDGKIDKLANQIVNILGGPDILVLQEIEDDSGTEEDGTTSAGKTLSELVDRIHENGGPDYAYVDDPPKDGTSGGIAGGNIRTVVLYRTDRGLEIGSSYIQSNIPVGDTFNGSRLPLILHFTFNRVPFYIIGVHLVSNSANSPEFGSIQPLEKPEEGERINQTRWLAKTSQYLLEKDPNSTIFIAGDFNDTPDSKAVNNLMEVNFVDLADFVQKNEQYSILFEGNAFLYDQIMMLSIKGTNLQINNASIVHANTYLAQNQQVSDHDPFSIDFSTK